MNLLKKFLLNPSPLALIYFVTSRCNCNCKHCFYHEDLNQKASEELTTDEIEKISYSLGRLLYLDVTGGEPFIRKDLYRIVNAFYRNCAPRKITVTTNGFYTAEAVDFAREVRHLPKSIVELNISIDALHEKHDSLRGSRGIFEKAIDTFLQAQKIKHEAENLRVGFIATAMKENMKSLREIVDFLKNMNPDFLSLNLIRGGTKDPGQKSVDYDDYERGLNYIRQLEITRDTSSILENLRRIKTEYLVELRKIIYLENKPVLKCLAGSRIAVLYPDGNVAPCESLEARMGNIRHHRYVFKDLWGSEQSSRIREGITEGNCFCTHECFLTASIVFSPKQLIKVLGRFCLQSIKKRMHYLP